MCLLKFEESNVHDIIACVRVDSLVAAARSRNGYNLTILTQKQAENYKE